MAVAAAGIVGSRPAPATATTPAADSMAAMVVGWLNGDRAAQGLVPLRPWPSLASLAKDRAARMVLLGTLSHEAAGGDPGAALTARGIPWYGFGEIIGESAYPWGSQSASDIYNLWKGSPFHRSLMFSATYNYVGVGFAYRSSDGSTWASVVFTESPDHTIPVARNGRLSASGTMVSFSWKGSDPRLQTHTAGLRSFDIQYRVDGGTWRLIRDNTTATGLTLWNRPRGHWYSFRVQAADRRGNLSRWTSATRIWVP